MRSFLQYLALVGLPLVGLLVILRYGEGLNAPASIGGYWVIEPVRAEIEGSVCPPLDVPAHGADLSISQSGRYVEVRVEDAGIMATGTFDGRTLTARGRAIGAELTEECPASVAVDLSFTFEGEASAPERFSGRWNAPGCGPCSSASFHGMRLPDN